MYSAAESCSKVDQLDAVHIYNLRIIIWNHTAQGYGEDWMR